ncbi:MAG: hypothetical protein RL326_49 [Pseudomonadota bacterium]|jgi:PAS domain S-box-containing protein
MSTESIRQNSLETGAGFIPEGHASLLLDKASNGIYLLDKEWRITYLNGKAISYFKKGPADAVGSILWEAFPSYIGSVFEIELRRAMREKVSVEFMTEFPTAPGRWVEVHAHPVPSGLTVCFLDITDRLTAESVLKTSEAQLHLLIDTAPALIGYVGPDYRYRLVNKEYESWFKVPREEILKNTMWDLIGAEGWKIIGPRIDQAMTGQTVTYEAEATYKDGVHRWIRAKYTPDLTPEGVLRGVMILVSDITNLKRAEIDLRESEQYHRSLFEAAGVGNAEIDLISGKFLRVNHKYCEILGYSSNELLSGRGFIDATHPEDRNSDSRAIQKFLCAETAAFEREKRYIRKNGEIVWVHATWTRITTADGKSSRALEVAQDISERKRAEEERQKFVSLAENSAEFIGMCDLNGVPFFVNEAGLRLSGLETLDRARQVEVKDFFFPEDQEFIMRQFFPLVLRDGRGEVEIRFRHFTTGEARWMIYNVFPISEASGRTVGFATVSRDITERKHAEQMLREADKRKDEFLATLAHELRNPLAPIAYALQLWPHIQNDPVKAKQMLSMVERQVEQLKRLIDDLLDASRISRGKIELRREPIDVATVINDAVDSVRPFIDANAHTLSVTLAEEATPLHGDKGRLMQVFGNLLHNAAKYTERNGRIWVSSSVSDGYVIVSVRDNGSGIPPEMLKRVFEPFTQVQRNFDRAQGGLGIGLTLVKALVEMHGGSVEARSDGPGRGSEFLVRLPLARTTAIKLSSSSKDRAWLNTAALQPAPHHRVLVVDDVRASADTLGMLLEGLGQSIRVAYDGASALKALDEFAPDIIFSDIAMPGMDGYSLAAQVRERLGDRPVLVALTGYGQKHDKQRALSSGFNHHLVKPASVEKLTEILAPSPS